MSLELPGGRRLLFAGAGQAWIWAAAGLAAVVLLAVLYREERRLVSRRAGLVLLGLRLAAAAVLVAALFEPIAAHTRVETVRGRVILAADVSESMSMIDADRSDGRSRREAARGLLEGPLSRLAADHDVAALAFAREGTPGGSAEALAALIAEPGPPDDPARLTSDPAPAFEAALANPDDRPVVGVVLLTDGRFNAPARNLNLEATLDRLKARGIPIHPVLIGSTRPPRDAAIADVKAPPAVYKGDVAAVDVVVKADGPAEGTSLTVKLERPGEPTLEKAVVVPAGGGRPVASFRVPFEKAGATPVSITVETPEGDVRPDNNRRVVTIEAADDKAAVLLVDGEARWEFRYLRNALARDPRVKLEAVLLRQPTPTGSIEPSYPTALPARPEAPDAADPLGSFDVIVLGDPTATEATAELWERIGKYVGERGGTLVLSPGPRGWPGALAAHETARALAPIVDPRILPADPDGDATHPSLPAGARLIPAAAAVDAPGDWPMLQLGSDPAASRAVWGGLPPSPWTLGGTAKPTATVLMTAKDGSPVVLSQPFGLGKVLWLGTDATWRWRFGVGDMHHHRFWAQVVRWASAQGLSAGDRHVRFGPTRPKVDEGESATIRARVSDAAPNVGPGLLMAAKLYPTGGDPDRPTAVVPLRPAPGQPRTFEGPTPSLPVGEYLVRLDAPGLPTDSGPDAPPIEARLTVATRETSERVELAAAREPLERLAAATGGRVFDESDAARLPELLKSRIKTETRTEETPIWDHPVGLLLFFGVLTAEWTVRRKAGLP